MRIVCDACATKYSIADEKVEGKVFKIRCKKCSNIIVVRGGSEAAPAPAAEPAAALDQKETRVYDYGADGARGGDDAIWHVVIDQEQVGPLAIADVQARLAAGEIDRETYAWREGLADWQPLAEVAELAHLVAGDLFDQRAAPAVSAVESRPVEAPAPAVAAPAAATAGSMRGQRNESSVLFSLGSLSAMAAPARAPAPSASSPASSGAAAHGGSEGSGLIDIRSMASAYLGPSKSTAASKGPRVGSADDLPVFSAATFSEPAVIIPMGGARNNNRLVFILLGAIALLAVVAVVLVVVVLGKSTTPAQAQPIASADPAPAKTSDPAPAKTSDPAPAKTDPAPAKTDPAPAKTDLAPAAPAADPAKTDAVVAPPPAIAAPADPKTPTTDRRRTTTPPATPPVKAPVKTPPVVPAAGTCHLDATECLLAAKPPACCSVYSSHRSTAPTPVKPPPVDDKDLPESLDRNAISTGLATVQSRAKACGAKSTAKGKVQVRIKVAASGAVTSVTVKESPDPALGACVQAAVMKGTFPRTQSGGSFEFPYHF